MRFKLKHLIGYYQTTYIVIPLFCKYKKKIFNNMPFLDRCRKKINLRFRVRLKRLFWGPMF